MLQKTKKMLATYIQDGLQDLGHFTSLFKVPERGGIQTEEQFEYDVVIIDNDIELPTVGGLDGGFNKTEIGSWYTKYHEPAVFKSETDIRGSRVIKRMPGDNQYKAPNYRANASRQALMEVQNLIKKQRNSAELMAVQSMTTGKITLGDFSIDFEVPSAFFPTVSVAWTNHSTATPISDIQSLALLILRTSLKAPNEIVMGGAAFDNFLECESVAKYFDKTGFDLSSFRNLTGRENVNGAVTIGDIQINAFKLELKVYPREYKNPADGLSTPYLPTNAVAMYVKNTRRDIILGAVPFVAPPDPRLNGILPQGPIVSRQGRYAVEARAGLSKYGENLSVGAVSRILTVPTSAGTFGCLTTA